MQLLEIHPHRDPQLYEAEIDLRYRVLREPLGMSYASARSPLDPESWHFVALDAQTLVGCALLHPLEDREGKLYQMAIAPPHHGKGIGRQLVTHLETRAQERGLLSIVLHARAEAIGFYERLGYACYGPSFLEVGIPHRKMQKSLASPACT